MHFDIPREALVRDNMSALLRRTATLNQVCGRSGRTKDEWFGYVLIMYRQSEYQRELLTNEVARLKTEADALRETLDSMPAPDATLNRLNGELRSLHRKHNLTVAEWPRTHERMQDAQIAHRGAAGEAAATSAQLEAVRAELAAVRDGLPTSVQKSHCTE
jgi:hypothetical protein